jgi:hypothetical protein
MSKTNYTSAKFEVNGTTWELLKAQGSFNYVTVRKLSNNPFKTLGKEFASEDLAIAHYKSMAMKAALIQILPTL